jgi:serine/threonine protein kinase
MDFDQYYGFSSPKKSSNKILDRQYGTMISNPADEYVISDIKLGEGSFSKVYLAQNIVTEATVVAKVINKKEIHDRNFYNLLMNEARILPHLHHKNIITIYETIEDDDAIIFFMDYYPGGDLSHLMKEHDYLSECMAYTIISQLVDAVQYLHERNIIHRDISGSEHSTSFRILR